MYGGVMLRRCINCVLSCMVCVLLITSADGAPKSIVIDSRFPPAPDTLGDGVQEFLDTLSTVGFADAADQTIVTPSYGSSIIQYVNEGIVDLGIDILSLQNTGDGDLDQVLDLYGDGIPFGLQSWEFIAFLEKEGITILETMLQAYGFNNVKILPLIVNTGQSAAMSRGPISNGKLSQGFKMRSFGIGQRVLHEAYDNMEFSDQEGGSAANIIAGFNDGSLYAAEFVNPCIDKTYVLDSVEEGTVTHYYIDNWQTPITLYFLMYRADLEDDGFDLGLLKAAQQVSLSASMPRLMRRQSECLSEIKEMGVEINTLPENVLEALRAATDTVLQQDEARNPHIATFMDSYREFVRQNQRWLNDGPIDRDFRFVGWPGFESDL